MLCAGTALTSSVRHQRYQVLDIAFAATVSSSGKSAAYLAPGCTLLQSEDPEAYAAPVELAAAAMLQPLYLCRADFARLWPLELQLHAGAARLALLQSPRKFVWACAHTNLLQSDRVSAVYQLRHMQLRGAATHQCVMQCRRAEHPGRRPHCRGVGPGVHAAAGHFADT